MAADPLYPPGVSESDIDPTPVKCQAHGDHCEPETCRMCDNDICPECAMDEYGEVVCSLDCLGMVYAIAASKKVIAGETYKGAIRRAFLAGWSERGYAEGMKPSLVEDT